MARTFQKFLQSKIDLSSVGLEFREDNAPYFCTPKGSSIFGWAGVDGIHFCFIRSFGSMVFSINPMNSSPNFVHPLARNFSDFLSLILACGDASTLEQSWMWDEAQFEAFLQDNPPTQEQQRTLSELAEKMKLKPMEHPWAYIKELQTSFDYSKIKYTEDYYDTDMNPDAEPTIPEWKVYFDGNFWGHSGKDRAGAEIRVDKQFEWEYYNLDISYGWMIFRAAFPWTSQRRPEIKSLSLTMEQQSHRVPGPHFKTPAPGDSFSFSHPVSGTKYTLTIQELEQQTISQKRVGSDRWFYPTHFTAMSYTLSPKPDDDIFIRDCADGDKPLEIAPITNHFAPEAQNDIVMIGGAYGATTILWDDSKQKNLHIACSALHFEPVSDDIEWWVEFNITHPLKKTFLLI